jgi:ABC-type glycerol-3-phosphate transport system permease component
MRSNRWPGKLFSLVNYAVLALLGFVTLYPFVYVFSASISNPLKVIAGEVLLWPKDITLEAYRIILGYDLFWIAYGNTIFYTIVGTFINVTLTVLAAYPLSRRWLYGRSAIQMFIVFTLFFSGGLIPNFLLLRDLHLLDTRWAMLLPGAVSVWNLLVTRTYFQHTIPDEIVEAAELDGASDLQVVWHVVLPLSLPIIAVITLFYAVGHWNEYFNALIYLRTRDLMPLQVILREIVVAKSMQEVMGDFVGMRAQMAEVLKYATIIVATGPIILLYPFLQRYFVKGALIGGLKE